MEDRWRGVGAQSDAEKQNQDGKRLDTDPDYDIHGLEGQNSK